MCCNRGVSRTTRRSAGTTQASSTAAPPRRTREPPRRTREPPRRTREPPRRTREPPRRVRRSHGASQTARKGHSGPSHTSRGHSSTQKSHVNRGNFSRSRQRSDIRLKEDITLLNQLDSGIGIYRFRYKGSDHTFYVGVMAQEVQEVMPSAVTRGGDGYLRVSYERLRLDFLTSEQLAATGGPAIKRRARSSGARHRSDGSKEEHRAVSSHLGHRPISLGADLLRPGDWRRAHGYAPPRNAREFGRGRD